jgi:tetratricopeptide (TPR) repeat protein
MLVLCLWAAMANQLKAQSTAIYNDPDASFKQAKDWYLQEKFGLAYPVFKWLAQQEHPASLVPEQLQSEAIFYSLVCALKQQDKTQETAALEFASMNQQKPLVQRMRYHLGEYFFQQEAFAKAQEQYEQTGIANLTNAEIASLKFHQGYGYFVMKDFNKAKPLFNIVRQLEKDPNYIEANYYYGFICFYEKDYKEALAGFRISEKDPRYLLVVPFYLSEIYYFNGQPTLALQTAQQALLKGGQFYDLQMRQLAGHILFEQRSYDKALPFLKQYVNGTEKVRREDLYELSYCYYEAANWPSAIEGFKQLGGGADSLAQNSMYLLANAYLKINDKTNARNAFQFCAANNSNSVQKEVASFHYAKLSYDLNFMDLALKELQGFIAKYPRSVYLPEARELLVSTLSHSNNFKEALVLYEQIGNKTESLKQLYPSLVFGRGVEYVNDQQLLKADSLFAVMEQLPNNQQQLALSQFWRGEIAYRMGKNEAAVLALSSYLKNPRTNGQATVLNAHYTLGYALLKMNNYAAAKANFEPVASRASASSGAIEQDAYLRAADCEFMLKSYKTALKQYEQIIAWQLPAADYAAFQKAIIAGALNKPSDKINQLDQFQNQFPRSTLLPDVQMEIANTQLSSENYAAAVSSLEKILSNPKAANYYPEVLLKLGVANFNLDKNTESLDYFKQLVKKYPNASQSNDAVDYIRNLFVAKQQPGDYISFMKENGKDISNNEADSLSFKSAMIRYEAKDFVSAQQGFESYLKGFSQGRYQMEAHYFTAEIALTNKNNALALLQYQAVADQAPNRYAERSSLQAARIYYFDNKDYTAAAKYFSQLKSIATQQENRLEAMRGLLRCQFKTEQWQQAAPNAQALLAEKGIAADDKTMANLVLAKNNQLQELWLPATEAYKNVITAGRSEWAAESQFRLAEIQFKQHRLPEAEKAAFEVIKKWGSYDAWVAKSYLLLGDIYFEQKDLFNAEATFKSIVDNASSLAVKKEAQLKLDQVLVEKNKTNKIEQQ